MNEYLYDVGQRVEVKQHKGKPKMGVIVKQFPAGVTTFEPYYLVKLDDGQEAYFSEDTTRGNHVVRGEQS